MSGRDYLHIWYQAQLVGALIFLIAVAWWNVLIMGRGIRLLVFILALIALEGLMITIVTHVPRWLQIVDVFLQTMLQPIMLIMLWGTVTREIIVRLHLPARGVIAITLLYYLIMFAPFASEIGGQLENVVARIVFLVYLFMTTVMMMQYFLPDKFIQPQLFKEFIGTGFWGALAFFVSVTVLMRAWHLSWPGLVPTFGTGWSWWVMSVLLAVYVIYVAFDIFQTGWLQFDFHVQWNRRLVLTALEAGIAEETLCRFGILGALLYACRNLTQRVPIAVGLSALCFGLLHLPNAAVQKWDVTILQAIFALGLGLYLAVVYLYTGQLWLTMLMHFFIDAAIFCLTHHETIVGSTSLADWIALTIEFLYFAAVTLWMMFGNRRVVMERHADRFTGDHQHFDFSFDFRM